jgi:hypothetical protein
MEYSAIHILIAWLIIAIDVFLLYKHRGNPSLLIINLVIAYFNYSICMGEYISGNYSLLAPGLYDTPNGNLYETGLYILGIFSLTRLLLFRRRLPVLSQNITPRRYNPLIYACLFSALIMVWVFEINRPPLLVFYTVHFSPIYEYAILGFIFLLYYQGKSKIRIVLSHLLALLFIAQDLYLGSRIVVIQLVLLFTLFHYSRFLKLKYIAIGGPIFLLIFTTIGIYRDTYALHKGIGDVISILANRLFILDTAIMAYEASITQLNALIYIDPGTRWLSFITFVAYVFGGSSVYSLFNLPENLNEVSGIGRLYHWNLGGGLIASWFYFWFGYLGLIIMSSALFKTLKHLLAAKKELWGIILLAVTMTVPRWYLYSPLSFIRGPFVFVPLLFIFLRLIDLTSAKSPNISASTSTIP